MEKENREARGMVHEVLLKAERAGELKNPLEYFAAVEQTECLFLDRIQPVWVDFTLDSIDYSQVKCNRTTDTVDKVEISNPTDVTLEEVLTRRESVTDQSTFTFTEGTKVGMSEKADVKLGIEELLHLGVEITYTLEFDFQAQQSITCQHTKEFDVDTKIQVPAHSSVTATIQLDKVTYNGPYTAYYKPVFSDEGRREWVRRMGDIKEYKGHSLEPLKYKSFLDLFPTLRNRLRVACKGRLNGVAGVEIKVVLSQPRELSRV